MRCKWTKYRLAGCTANAAVRQIFLGDKPFVFVLLRKLCRGGGSFRWVTAKTSVIDAYMRRAMRFVIKAKGVLVEINLPSPIDLALAMVILEVLRRLK